MEVSLSHVCRRWWEVAVSTPTLWLEIEGPEYPGKPGTKRTEAYLARSTNRMIDVSLLVTADGLGKERADWGEDFLNIIIQHSERWRSFTLRLPEAYAGTDTAEEIIIDALENVSIPQLQRAELRIDLPGPGRYSLVPLVFLRGTPKLSQLQLGASWRHWFIVPMNTITTLTIHSEGAPIPTSDIFNLRNLRHLNITRKTGYAYSPSNSPLPLKICTTVINMQYPD